MAFEKITNLINQEMVFLEREATLVDGSLKRISIVLRDNPCNNLEELINVNNHEMVCAYIALNSNMPYDDAYACLRGLPQEHELDTIKTIIDLCDLEDSEEDNLLKKVSIASKRNKVKEEDYQKIKRIYKNDTDLFRKALVIWEIIDDIKDTYASFNIAFDKDKEVKEMFIGTGKNKEAVRRDYIYGKHEVERVINFFRNMVGICDIKKKQEKNINRNANKRIGDYNTLMKLLSSEKLEKTMVFDECLGYLNNSEMQKVFIQEYQDYIQGRYKVVKEKHDTLIGNSDTRLKALFKKYNFNFNEIDEETKKIIISINYDDVEKMMDEISKLGIEEMETYVYLLVKSNLEIIQRFNNDVKDGYINKEYLLEHLNLMSIEKDNGLYYKHYLRVVTLLKEKNLNLLLFENCSEIYGYNIELVNKNLNILDNYGLLGSLKTCTSVKFFGSEDLERRIDALLELGYEELLVKNLDLLNYDYEIIKRIYAYKSIGEIVENPLEVLDSRTPIVPDENLDEYISNVADIEVGSLIDSYQFNEVSNGNSGLTMSVNGILFSRNRVLRNSACLKDQELIPEEKEYYALIMNGIYSFEELQRIKTSYRDAGNKRMI